VFADREFYAADVIEALEEREQKYVIPVPKRDRLKQELERMPNDRVSVKHEYGFYGPVKHGVSNERVETTLVVLPPDEKRDHKQPFATNLEVDDEIGIDRRSAKRRIKRYQNRGGIENAYKKIKEFAAWTTSKEFEVRLFHFGFAVLLYNMWLLVDFLVQVSMEGEVRSKPRITATRFRGFLDRRVSALL
jgi:IS4 transposase